MPRIVEGQLFTTLADFKEALREWAVEEGFAPHILDSDKQRVRAGCRSGPDCPFRIRVNYNIKLHAARVTTVEGEHTCARNPEERASQQVKRSEIAKLSFLIKVVPQLIEVNSQTRANHIIEAVEKRYGQRLLYRQAQKVRAALTKKPCRHCHQFGHSSRRCPQRPASASAEPDAEGDTSSDEAVRPRKRSRCLVCFGHGHNRKNCPQRANVEAENRDAAILESQLTSAAYAPNMPPLQRFEGTFALQPMMNDDEPTLPNHDEHTPRAPIPGPPIVMPTGPFPPNRTIEGPQNQANVGASQQQRQGPQQRPPQGSTGAQRNRPGQQAPAPSNPKVEAARLMQQAASLMQEAGRLNFEAARLMASVE